MSDEIAKIPAFGLTGGVASGKSTVAQYLQSLGAKIIDADRVGHELLRPGSPAYPLIISTFGPEVLTSAKESARAPQGAIDRQRLAAIVFADPQKLRALNAILHPLILLRILEITAQHREREPGGVTVVEAPLIYEAEIEKNFVKVIVAWCRPEQQLERLLAKGGISHADAEARIAAQIAPDEKRRRADYVIDCSTTIEATGVQAKALYPELQRVMTALSG
ncbi:MAG: dephospho-CoA kinase [Terriglobia bacterium]